jgi:hypothetical protein
VPFDANSEDTPAPTTILAASGGQDGSALTDIIDAHEACQPSYVPDDPALVAPLEKMRGQGETMEDFRPSPLAGLVDISQMGSMIAKF